MMKRKIKFHNFLKKTPKNTEAFNRERKFEQLFLATSKFHSSMNTEDVLDKLIEILKQALPDFAYFLLLSHDNSNNHRNLPIKVLQYDQDSSNISAIQSYVTGTVQLEDLSTENTYILYVPLKGNQGVYGVLQVISENYAKFSDSETEFISLLVNTAGNALENAQLYHQSKRLVKDLQLINETSHHLNSILRLNDAMDFMSKQIIQSFDAEEVGFILFDSHKTTPLPGSTSFFLTAAAKEYVHFVVSRIINEKELLFIGDITADYQFQNPIYRSLMAVPMVQSNELKGVAIVLHPKPYFFSFETFKLLQSLIMHSTLVFTNSILREELEKLVITDYLTKLFSRNYLDERIQFSMKHDNFGVFILIDIDDFKKINDNYGHHVGDESIIQVAKIIKSSIRANDIGARWGGEELAIYLPKVEIELGVNIAERLVKRVYDESNPKITISCGVAFWRVDNKESTFNLFKRADKALYIAKNTGKNRVVIDNNYNMTN